MSMTPEKATALRRPFPPESVGQLPKGGVMLDYVGHAAVTDRLLTVDPEWSWDFAETDPATGKPSLRHSIDPEGNLWIRLTICGITRIGVGDGKNMKERIGDALRNASMRFGVALDLWAKENLVEFAQAANGQPTPEHAPPVKERKAERVREPQEDEWTQAPDEPKRTLPMADKTRARMFALFGEQGINDADQQRDGIARIVGHPIASRSELTEGEAVEVIKALKARPKPDQETARNF